MDKKRKRIIAGNTVSQVYRFPLGGYKQKVLVEGRTKQLPVVIVLHGGPGTPLPFSVGCRGLFPEFTNRFLMVYWDQLGCGCNDHVIDESFCIDSFVQMACDLVKKVKGLFPDNKIYLFSMSWGTILSVKILEKDPYAADGVVAWGQIVRDLFFNEEVMRALEASRLPKKKLAAVRAADKNHASPKDLQLVSASIRKYTSGYQNKKGAKAPTGPVIKGLLTSPDYRLKDFKAVMVNGYRGNKSLWKEILQIDLSQTLREVRIPYVILQGDTDIVTSTKTVSGLVREADNDYLRCEIVKNSGHMPGSEGMERVLERIVQLRSLQGLPQGQRLQSP